MYIPPDIFGFKANPKDKIKPKTIAQFEIEKIQVEVLQYELTDFISDNFPGSDGHFLVYHVSTPEHEEYLRQKRSTFFISDDNEKPISKTSKISQGDGIKTPK